MTKDERTWFLQIDERKVLDEAGTGAWTTIWEQLHDQDTISVGRSCALSPPVRRAEVLADSSWDLLVQDGRPGFSVSYVGDSKRAEYSWLPLDNGVEPLVHHRTFHGMRSDYIELSEEFRLFHDLCDSGNGEFIKLEDDGTEWVAARVTPDLVKVSTRLIRQYQAARQLDLLLFVDNTRFAKELPIGAASPDEEIAKETVRASFYCGDLGSNDQHFSRFLGKKLIPAPPIDTCGIWPFDDSPQSYPEFIIGIDDDGRDIRFTCDPEQLANYFGANPGAPHYLTPVHFKREVLQRYYDTPEKYSVEDGYLRCMGLWGLRMDNDHSEHVVVYLGDLGRDLPERERSIWLAFNVLPSDSLLSETAVRRDFFAQFTSSTSSDLVFRRTYEQIAQRWQEKFGWDLYRTPNPGDEHIIQRIRLPLSESAPEFEGQLLNIAKLMIDFLNDGKLKASVATDVAGMQSISKLEAYFSTFSTMQRRPPRPAAGW